MKKIFSVTLLALFAINTHAQLHADISPGDTTICEDSCIQFINKSTYKKPLFWWDWEFENYFFPFYLHRQDPLSPICYNYAGSYNVTLTITDSMFNSDIKRITVTVKACINKPIAHFFIPSTSVCWSDSVHVLDMSEHGPESWNWTITPATGVTPTSSTIQNPTICFDSVGTYTITLIASNSNGSSDPVSKTVTVSNCTPIPKANFSTSTDTLCKDSSIIFTDKSIFHGNPPIWLWTFEGGNPASFNGQNPPAIFYHDTGVHVVSLHVENSVGSTTHRAFVKVNLCACNGGVIKSFLRDDTICAGTPVVLSDSSAEGYIQWQVADSGLNFTDIPAATQLRYISNPLVDTTTTTTFYRVVTHTNTCKDTSNIYASIVTVLPSPIADFNMVQGPVWCSWFFHANITPDITSYEWDFGRYHTWDTSFHNVPDPFVQYLPWDDSAYACLTVYNGSKCSFTRCQGSGGGSLWPCWDGIESVTEEKRFIISPNPCTTCELRSVADAKDIVVTDLLGRTINTSFTKTPQGFSINLERYPSGVYFIKNMRTGEVAKFVKE